MSCEADLPSGLTLSLITTSFIISKPSTIFEPEPLTTLLFECLEETDEVKEVSPSEFESWLDESFV